MNLTRCLVSITVIAPKCTYVSLWMNFVFIYLQKQLFVPQDFNLLEKLGTKSPLNIYLHLFFAKINDKIAVPENQFEKHKKGH